MQWLVYVRHPDETSMFIDAVADQDEAITLCHDLVVVDGYERAEIWSEDGDRLYCVERREGASLHTVNDLDRTAALRLRPLADAPPPDKQEGPARDARRTEPPRGTPEPPRILGERPGHEERWLGL